MGRSGAPTRGLAGGAGAGAGAGGAGRLLLVGALGGDSGALGALALGPAAGRTTGGPLIGRETGAVERGGVTTTGARGASGSGATGRTGRGGGGAVASARGGLGGAEGWTVRATGGSTGRVGAGGLGAGPRTAVAGAGVGASACGGLAAGGAAGGVGALLTDRMVLAGVAEGELVPAAPPLRIMARMRAASSSLMELLWLRAAIASFSAASSTSLLSRPRSRDNS